MKGRRWSRREITPGYRFNPRPREGATANRAANYRGGVSFNPRPREGATLIQPRSPDLRGFNPRPREGATGSFPGLRVGQGVSIHAPVKGRRS